MDVAITPFSPELLPLVAGFSERYWARPRTESFYRWRYLDSQPFSRMFLAVGSGECVGLLFALRKRYIVNGDEVPCLEVFDWHCLPELKGAGVGIRLMRAMMRLGDRLVSIGGTADVLSTLPAMGWQRVATARRFELPVSGEALADGLQRRARVPAALSRVPLRVIATGWFSPRRRAVPGAATAVPVSMVGEEVAPLYAGPTGYDLVQRPDEAVLRWLSSGFPGTGSFRFLSFVIDGRLRGWGLTRLYMTPVGTEGAIVELFAPGPDLALYTWMVSEAACSLAGGAPKLIRARATCPMLQAALRANRFREADLDIPVQTWPRGIPGTARAHLTLNHSDEPIRPYPAPSETSAFFAE